MTAISIFPIGVAAIASFIIGSLWYSPLLFGRHWAALVGIDDKQMEEAKARGVIKLYVAQFITTLVTFSVLAFLFAATGTHGGWNGAVLGFFVWLGFVVTEAAGKVMWERKSTKLTLINIGSSLLSLLLGGAIIGAWIG